MSIDEAVQVTGSASAEDFAKYYGFEVPTEEVETPDADVEGEAAEASPDDTAPVDADAAEKADAAEATVDEEPAPEKPAAPAKKLPFGVTDADGNDVATTLADVSITFKADGAEHTLPLADVVRRAQSEAGLQRQVRAEREEKQQYLTAAQQKDADIEQLRALALRAVLDDEYRESLRPEVEAYYSPEARAERAEQQLAATRQAEQQAVAERQRIAERVGFLENTVAPIFSTLREKHPLVTEEELLGKFTADTQRWTVNGEIPPKFYGELERYLAGEWTQFASKRHAEAQALQDKVAKETRKAQVEEQKRKNESASRSKPTGSAPPMRENMTMGKPKTYKEANAQGLSVLLDGIA